jgi:hypothetical protein
MHPMPPGRAPSRTRTCDPARVRALDTYEDFFTLWKDADSDIPILTQAKQDYAKLPLSLLEFLAYKASWGIFMQDKA